MLHVYITCGEWISCTNKGSSFLVDEAKGGRLLALDSTSTLKELHAMVVEDYGMELQNVKIKFGYLLDEFVNKAGSPHIIISNDRQLRNFISYVKKNPAISLRVTLTHTTAGGGGIETPVTQTPVTLQTPVTTQTPVKPVVVDISDDVEDSDDDFYSPEADVQMAPYTLENVVKKSERFESKRLLKSKMELCANKFNFDYKVIKYDTIRWSIRCKNKLCNWGLCAHGVRGSKYFVITNYVAKHTCAPSSKTKGGKTPSAKTIGGLVMYHYKNNTDGPTPNDIITMVRNLEGVELNYSLAYEAREYAISVIRGIPEKSYEKIPKYLYMIKAANPGTHTNYEIDSEGRFNYLFLSFGQSIRGFHNTMRKVIIVDGTFLKNKFRGTLLVATTLDGNSNVYPIAFGIVDSENDSSWDWFLMQLSVVIPDEHGLAFISDRHSSIVKAVENVYPSAEHNICIHHLISNVVSKYQGRNMAALVAEASKLYWPADFEKKLIRICNISLTIGKYLLDADVRKWARSLFPGFRYNIRTSNPAETINSALRVPREYPVIPLLDSIREMMTRWFYKRRVKSSNHQHPLTVKVEAKIARRIKKGQNFKVIPTNDNKFHVLGDKIDCVVDLVARTCSCGKYDLIKIPCRHAIKAGLSVGRDSHSLTDYEYTTDAWRVAYAESVNPVNVPEDEWRLPNDVGTVQVLPPESKRGPGRLKKRRYESVKDKISSKGPPKKKLHRCSRCLNGGHNRRSCTMPI